MSEQQPAFQLCPGCGISWAETRSTKRSNQTETFFCLSFLFSFIISFFLSCCNFFFHFFFFFLPQEEREKNEKKTKKQEQKTIRLTVSLPPLNCSLIFSRISTTRLISRWSRRPKSLNMVEPPERTIFLYRGRLTSIGQFWITVSTISDIGVVKSGLANCNNATAKMKQ